MNHTGESVLSKQYWIAGVVGGIAMYVWMSVAHVVTPIGAIGISQISGEGPLLTLMTTALADKPGLYMFPAMDEGADAMDKYGKKLQTMPSGMVVYRRAGAKPLDPVQLLGEFALEMVLVLLGVWLLSKTVAVGFGARLGFFCVVGLVASLWTNVSYWNWYTFPANYTLANILTEFTGFAVVGLVVAAMLGRGQGRRMET